MNLSQYKELCSVCDEILTSPNSSVVTKSNPWLHVLNAHPTTQQKYVDIWDKDKKKTAVAFLLSLAKFFRNICSGDSRPKFLSSNPASQHTDVLIISHLINESQIGVDKDFYYGDISLDLKKDNIDSQVVLMNHLSRPPNQLVGCWNQKSTPRIFLANRLTVKKELNILFKLSLEALRLFRTSNLVEGGLRKSIYRASAWAAMSIDSIRALRFFYQIEDLVKDLRPRAIITTMEGHAFERLAFYASRRVNRDIKCCGYQHAILFPYQHGVKRSLGPDYDPDIIFTAGGVTAKTLLNGYQRANINLENIGTHRFLCPSTIFDISECSSPPVCLVLPDGNLLECLDLCRFALIAAETIPERPFRIRLHPLTTVDMLISEDRIFSKLPENLSFSTNKEIQDDFEISRWSLYRGSGAAIHSVMAGCRPIYIGLQESITIDPLYEIDSGRKYASSVRELEVILTADFNLEHKVFLAQLEPLFQYCKEYFMPSNTKKLIDALT